MTQGSLQSVDLTQCEREPVHIPGSIQPFGVLVAFSLPTWSIVHVSENAPALFGAASPVAMIDQPMSLVLSPQLIHDLRNVFQAAMISGFSERMPAVPVGTQGIVHDIIIYASGPMAIAEFLPCGGTEMMRSDPTTLVKTIIDRLRRTTTFQTFLTSAARQIRAVTGFDRVMIYKFLEDDSGKVVAEALRAGMTPFMGLHYPASDIPSQARALFKRQWLRMIPEVDYTPIPIYPTLTAKNLPVDLSLSTLRSASPIHCAYLRNMGSAATMTVSIMLGDRLWGLIACHHERPRRLSAATAAAVELFAQVFSTQIDAKQHQDELAYVARARVAHDALVSAMAPEETIFENVRRFSGLLHDLIPCDGIGVWSEGRFEGEGAVPPSHAIDELVQMLNTKPADRLFVTEELKRHLPDALRYTADVSGLVAIPFGGAPRVFLMLFRREVIQTVNWGGDPNKAASGDMAGNIIGPRASFAAWKETVGGKCLPWHTGEISVAETLRVSLLNVILRRANLVDRERKVAQESQLLLVAELNHRVKNVLAVIRSLVRQSRAGADSLDSFTEDLQSRINALSVAHDQLTQSHRRAAPLHTLIEAEARAWIETDDDRLAFSGPPVMVEARAYQTLALVLHELMTNAAKYGALSSKVGRLSINWALETSGDLKLTWHESDGPQVVPPKRRGFGSVVVEQSIPFELRGESTISYAPEGVQATFRIPYDFVQRGEASEPRRETMKAARLDLQGKALLLVEDSMLIALDAQAMLQACGADVELAATSADALRSIRLNAFDAAILDVNLYIETSFAVAEDLQNRAIPFVFATGYGETVNVPDRFKTVQVISKPYTEDALRAALAIHDHGRHGEHGDAEIARVAR